MWPESLWPKSLKSFKSLASFIFLVTLLVSQAGALDDETVRQIKKLKEAGLSDQAIVEIIRATRGDHDPQAAVGVKEIPREDGQKDILYYSVSTPEERKGDQECREDRFPVIIELEVR